VHAHVQPQCTHTRAVRSSGKRRRERARSPDTLRGPSRAWLSLACVRWPTGACVGEPAESCDRCGRVRERVLFIERYRRLGAEGTYNTKHAQASRLYYTTTYIHTHTPTELKLGHAHERRCDPNRLEQHVVARHEAEQHDGARRGGHRGSQQPERTP